MKKTCISSLLPKIDELRSTGEYSNVTVIGITETKLGYTVNGSEVTVDGSSIVWNDRDRMGGGVACYIRSNICYLRKTCLSGSLENISINILFPKPKLISVGINDWNPQAPEPDAIFRTNDSGFWSMWTKGRTSYSWRF